MKLHSSHVLLCGADKQQVLQILDRLQAKLREKRDSQHNENLTILRNTLRSPLFNQVLTLQQSIKQLKEQVSVKVVQW